MCTIVNKYSPLAHLGEHGSRPFKNVKTHDSFACDENICFYFLRKQVSKIFANNELRFDTNCEVLGQLGRANFTVAKWVRWMERWW